MSKPVYITSIGICLPNKPISNDEMEDYLGRINGKDSLLRKRILKQNGIEQRHYAIDLDQNTTHSNAKLASIALKNAIDKSEVRALEIDLLCVGTTQGDLPIPGMASMVHALSDIGACEISNFQSVCSSGVMAINYAFAQISLGKRKCAAVIGSELASRLFKSSRFEAQGIDSLNFDTEFLRWMLSDGAGCMILQSEKPSKGKYLEINWIDLEFRAHEYPLCMYAGKNDNKDDSEKSWLDFPSFEEASKSGAINLKQDVRQLDKVVKVGVSHFFDLIDRDKIDPKKIDWLCCHYSSLMFKSPIQELLKKGGAEIIEERWFSNLQTKGNTGSASIFIMLEELFYSDKLSVNDDILCMVPESGRFITSFMSLKVKRAANNINNEQLKNEIRKVEAPELVLSKTKTSEWLIRNLTKVWIDFETSLLQVPIVTKIHSGTLSIEDYKLLLKDLRQQVIDGSQWIARAASNIDIDLFELRSAFIKHTAAEHKDYQLLEKNYVALGEDLASIIHQPKNIGSIALSSFIFQQASKPNPVDLLGAMFIIEGIGKRLSAYWGGMIMNQLNLREDQVSFFTYHGVADENHFHNLEKALEHPAMNMEVAKKIVQTAKVCGMLYRMQLEELGNY